MSARQIIDDYGVRQGAVVVLHDVTDVMDSVAASKVLDLLLKVRSDAEVGTPAALTADWHGRVL